MVFREGWRWENWEMDVAFVERVGKDGEVCGELRGGRDGFRCRGMEEVVDEGRIGGRFWENYEAICCSDDVHVFGEENFIAKKNRGEFLEDYIEGLRNKDSDMNFLKIPFFKCFMDDEEVCL